MRYSVHLLVSFIVVQSGLAQNEISSGKVLTDTLEAVYDSGALVGFSVALVNEDGIQYVRGFGRTGSE